jgi:hypothetical protein
LCSPANKHRKSFRRAAGRNSTTLFAQAPWDLIGGLNVANIAKTVQGRAGLIGVVAE